MNIISYNVRGLGRGVKWAAIRRLIKKYQLDMICIQETKKEQVDKTLCQALWGDLTVGCDSALVILVLTIFPLSRESNIITVQKIRVLRIETSLH